MAEASHADRTLRRFSCDVLHITLLAVPVLEVLDSADNAQAPEEHLARAWVVRDVVRLSRPVREVRHAALAGDEPVGDARCGRTGDHVAGTNRVLLPLREPSLLHDRRGPELEHPRTLEDHEDLFLFRVAVRRRARLPRAEAHPVEAGGDRAGGAGEVAPVLSLLAR